MILKGSYLCFVFVAIFFVGALGECERKKTSNCVVFDNINVKTFDGNVFSFESECDYELISVNALHLKVNILRKESTVLQIKYGGRIFEVVIEDLNVHFTRDGTKYSLPQTLNGLSVSKPGRMVIVEIKDAGMKIRFDGATVEIIQNNDDFNFPILGLCGDNDGCPSNDLITADGNITDSQICFANSWTIDDESCTTEPFTHACGDNGRLQAQALNYCTKLFENPQFTSCWEYTHEFRDICTSLYCSCKLPNRDNCMCDMLDSFVKTCDANDNSVTDWRTATLCPIECANPDQSFSACAPGKKQLSCGEDDITDPSKYDCEEGCYCPEGMRLFEGKCLFADECPCYYDDMWFNPGVSIAQDCNTCTCRRGMWECTEKICTVPGEAWGDPHYITFDGRKYDFMGKCTYYVVRGIGFDVMCDHYIHVSGGFIKDFTSSKPSYCAKVIVQVQNDIIELEQKHVVKVNGQLVGWLPHTVSGIRISKPSSQFTEVALRNYVTVSWNGVSRIVVNIPTSMNGRVNGLFGTYNKDPLDDWTMPNGTLATNANEFGHSWVVPDTCAKDVNTDPVEHPCEQNPSKKPEAEERCGILKSQLFAGCSDDVESDYEACVYDGCFCPDNDPECLCDFYAQQAEKCAAQGRIIDWRETITECAIDCPKGQKYQVCGNSCTRSCDDISANPSCSQRCVDGCNCPPGETLNSNDECIPISECPCIREESRYPPNFTVIDPKENDKYTCENGLWSVTPAEDDDESKYPTLDDLENKCDINGFLTFSGCTRNNELTCLNKHLNERPNFDNCEAGCECIEGFIMDKEMNMCVRPEDCPCMHNGISHPDDAVVNDKEQKCVCVYGLWECTPQTDRWEKCTVWGDVHVRTFDENIFSFTGFCEYVLFEHRFDNTGVFRVNLQTESCATGSCIAGVFVYYREDDGHTENIVFITDSNYITTNGLTNLKLTDMELSAVVDIEHLGVKVIWNKAGWVHIHVSSSWLTLDQSGLCGVYDNDASNDLEIPNEKSVGIADFVNYNRDDDTCGDASALEPNNGIFPDNPCNIFYGDVFRTCRLSKPVDEYFNRCTIEANAQTNLTPEDRSGQFCQTIAAYAQECNDAGVLIQWRTDELCPQTCIGNKEYSPCEVACERETCNNPEVSCSESICSEACVAPKCADGEVYEDSTYQECINKDECIFCITN